MAQPDHVGSAVAGTAASATRWCGSDVTMAETTAVKDDDQWVINGTKMFATNGGIADFMLVFCRTDPENLSRHKRYSWWGFHRRIELLVPCERFFHL
jgi:acyl-CoA dehydrogenase